MEEEEEVLLAYGVSPPHRQILTFFYSHGLQGCLQTSVQVKVQTPPKGPLNTRLPYVGMQTALLLSVGT